MIELSCIAHRRHVNVVKGGQLWKHYQAAFRWSRIRKNFAKLFVQRLGERPELQVVGEVTDGLQAIQKAVELQPGLIVLDIGLPALNGIEVARQIRRLSPECKILLVSQESSVDVVRDAIHTGGSGYVVKTDAGQELLEAVNAVLRGEQFVGKRFAGHDFVGAPMR